MLYEVAAATDRTCGEWAREVLLVAAQHSKHDGDAALFAEVQALRLLLINTLEPLLARRQDDAGAVQRVLRYVKANKRKASGGHARQLCRRDNITAMTTTTMGTQRDHRPPATCPVYSFAAVFAALIV